jgi:putative flippase GtrA
MINRLAGYAGHIGLKPKEAERFIKFLFVGTIGFILDFGTLTLLVELVGLPVRVAEATGFSTTVGLVLANTVSFSLAVLSNFTFNRYWTYPESRSKKKRVQLPQFAFVSVAGLLLNNLILALLEGPFSQLMPMLTFMPVKVEGYIPAKIVATIVVLFWNFFVNRFWTFGNVD